MTTATNVRGTCDTRFRAVEDAFRDNLERFGEFGAALCVYVDGEPVLAVWGGHADPDAKVGFGYVMNQMLTSDTLDDPRWRPLMDAINAAL